MFVWEAIFFEFIIKELCGRKLYVSNSCGKNMFAIIFNKKFQNSVFYFCFKSKCAFKSVESVNFLKRFLVNS